ncbi:hypothetical protein K438DRAFT_1974368 [Mycena galopus ATCC 62051]|nr:hypothetical protein K438DRAFT_1974368 [Mycena galopus ATCC 62051]
MSFLALSAGRPTTLSAHPQRLAHPHRIGPLVGFGVSFNCTTQWIWTSRCVRDADFVARWTKSALGSNPPLRQPPTFLRGSAAATSKTGWGVHGVGVRAGQHIPTSGAYDGSGCRVVCEMATFKGSSDRARNTSNVMSGARSQIQPPMQHHCIADKPSRRRSLGGAPWICESHEPRLSSLSRLVVSPSRTPSPPPPLSPPPCQPSSLPVPPRAPHVHIITTIRGDPNSACHRPMCKHPTRNRAQRLVAICTT